MSMFKVGDIVRTKKYHCDPDRWGPLARIAEVRTWLINGKNVREYFFDCLGSDFTYGSHCRDGCRLYASNEIEKDEFLTILEEDIMHVPTKEIVMLLLKT